MALHIVGKMAAVEEFAADRRAHPFVIEDRIQPRRLPVSAPERGVSQCCWALVPSPTKPWPH